MAHKKNKDFHKSQLKPLYEEEQELRNKAKKCKPCDTRVKYDIKR